VKGEKYIKIGCRDLGVKAQGVGGPQEVDRTGSERCSGEWMKLAQNCLVANGRNWLTTVVSGERIVLILDCVQWLVDETGSVVCPMVSGRNRLRTVQW